MRIPFLILVLTTCASSLFAQEKVDSIKSKVNATVDRFAVDSVTAKLNPKLNPLPDSLLPAYKKVDSVKNEFTSKAQSIRNSYDSSLAKIDHQRTKLNSTIDSLESLRLPTGKYTNKLDSLANVQKDTENKFNSKLADLKSKTTGKLNALDLPPEYKEPLQSLTKNIDNVGLTSDVAKIPGLEIPGFEMPKLDAINGVDIPNTDLSKYGQLPKIDTPVGDLGKVTENLKGVQDDVKAVTSGNLNDAQNLPKTLEAQAGKLDGVQELQKESAAFQEMQGKLEPLKDPAAGKDKVAEIAKEAAVDHFAGKDQQLKAAMDQMSKYKSKYSSVSSLKDLPKRPPNPMKEKPFIERVVPGLYFQYQQKGFNLFDFNPYVGYRISGRFTSGAGWNQRYARDKKKESWNRNARVYGPRVYVDFRMFKGFIAHVESEYMNTFVPTDLKNQTYEIGNREWVWSVMTGIKKDYKIYKNLRGTVLLQYNLFNPKFKAPYVDRLNSRIGFEYVLKKKKKTQAAESQKK